DVEQTSYEGPVALDDLLAECGPVRGRPLEDEATLRAGRDDDCVLHGLRLHQPEDLGAEVLTPVRPADAAARDPAGAEVDALHPRRVDGDLEHRPRLRQVGDAGWVELEGQVRLGPAV